MQVTMDASRQGDLEVFLFLASKTGCHIGSFACQLKKKQIMKKTLLSAALLAACVADMSAQKITFIPFTENTGIQANSISANGKYVGGTNIDLRAFLYNVETGEMKYFTPTAGDSGDGSENDANVYAITSDGVGAGYIDNAAAQFSFATGEFTKVLPEETGHSLLKFTTADGSFTAGATYNDAYTQFPFYIVDGQKYDLPTPSESWLGFGSNGFSLYGGNADGSVLVGYANDDYDTRPLMLWVRNADGKSYSVETLCRQYVDESFELDGPQKYDMFEGAAISDNGEWLAVNLHVKNDEETGIGIGRFNLNTYTLEVIKCPAEGPDYYNYANSIANDGTIVGYSENQITYGRTAIICKGGETEAKLLSDEFPTLAELKVMDNYEFNSPNMITPDGRYITGFGYQDLDEQNLAYASYVIDTQAETGAVEGVEAAEKANKVVAAYGIDGKKTTPVAGAAKRLTVNRYANGAVRKVVK